MWTARTPRARARNERAALSFLYRQLNSPSPDMQQIGRQLAVAQPLPGLATSRWLSCRDPHDRSVMDYAAAPAEGHTAFLVAHLTASPNLHLGGFNWRHLTASRRRAQDLRDNLKTLLDLSPGLCACQRDNTCSLHVAHDQHEPELQPELQAFLSKSPGITLHEFEPNPKLLGNDRRYFLFDRLLRGNFSWDCAFISDIDVFVLAVPPCGRLAEEKRLVIGSDNLLPSNLLSIRKWLRTKARQLQFNGSRMMRAFLNYTNYRKLSFACGILGGPRGVLLPALTSALSQYRSIWANRPDLKLVPGLDMLVWTDIALNLRGAHVVTGYPVGPVNLPMTWYPWHHGVNYTEETRARDFVNATQSLFWLAHKKQSSPFLDLFQTWTDRCRASQANGGGGRGRGRGSSGAQHHVHDGRQRVLPRCDPSQPVAARYVRPW